MNNTPYYSNSGYARVYKILIIEDSLADFELYKHFLEKDDTYHYEIEYAETARDGLDCFHKNPPDFILVDFSLPDMNGLELIEEIQKSDSFFNTPIIMLTGQGSETIALQAMKHNIHDYFSKRDLSFEKFIKGIYAVILDIENRQLLSNNPIIDLLLIDPVEANLNWYRSLLEKPKNYQFNIYTVTTGQRACEVCQSKHIDIVITGYDLPDITGLDVIKFLKKSQLDDIAIIMIADRGDERLVVDAMKSGAADYLVKSSLTAEKLLETIDETFHKTQLINQLNKTQLQQNLISRVSLNIRQSINLTDIIEASVSEIRNYLQCDRVLICQIHETGFCTVVGEARHRSVSSLLNLKFEEDVFHGTETQQTLTVDGKIISHVETSTLDPRHRELLQHLGVKSIASFPLIISDTLWGFLILHFCQDLHFWESREIAFLSDLSLQISIGIQHGILVEELKKERDRANASDQAKSIFLANMSHEIRTPMTGILGMAELLSLSPLDDQDRHFIQVIQTCGENLLRIINDILDISKLESGNITLGYKDFCLSTLLDDLLAFFELSIQKKGLQLQVQIQENLPLYYKGDADRLKQILINLIGNAIKFTHQGTITLSIDRLRPSTSAHPNPNLPLSPTTNTIVPLHISVQDQGIGIPLADQPRLFDAFYQVENSATRSFQGTGLGLSISKKLVQLMGGEIGVKSAPDQGSTFWFTIPLAMASPPQHLQSSVLHSKEPKAPPQPTKILVAEDNLMSQQVTRHYLQTLGYDCDIASHGQMVLELLTQNSKSYALVLMDCQMPVLDGYETTRALRKHPDLHTTIVIGLTAYAMIDDRQKCLQAGMNDYLSKPYSIQDLQAIIEPWIRHKKMSKDSK